MCYVFCGQNINVCADFLQFVLVKIYFILLSFFLTANAAQNREDYNILEDIPSDSSDDEYSNDSDDEWLPENNRDIGDEDDEGDPDSQHALSKNADSKDDVMS